MRLFVGWIVSNAVVVLDVDSASFRELFVHQDSGDNFTAQIITGRI